MTCRNIIHVLILVIIQSYFSDELLKINLKKTITYTHILRTVNILLNISDFFQLKRIRCDWPLTFLCILLFYKLSV